MHGGIGNRREDTMRTIQKTKLNIIRVILIWLVFAAITQPLALTAAETESELQRSQLERAIVYFDANGGQFPAEETREGLRFPNVNTTLTDFPPNPIRSGYVFYGWQVQGSGQRLPENSVFVNVVDLRIVAMWTPYGHHHNTPTPAPTTTPRPTTTPAPTPSKDAPRPNPDTNPIAISFAIFIAVITLGFAAFCIIKLTAHHAMATDKYNTDTARHEREARLTEILDSEDTKQH